MSWLNYISIHPLENGIICPFLKKDCNKNCVFFGVKRNIIAHTDEEVCIIRELIL